MELFVSKKKTKRITLQDNKMLIEISKSKKLILNINLLQGAIESAAKDEVNLQDSVEQIKVSHF